jgi:hyperosmotically inducible periplasmic protein
MSVRRDVAALVVVAAVIAGAGCAETRGREGTGAYVDDDAITSTVKARLVEDKTVDANAIQVETAHGTVVLSGVARTALEKNTVESIAMKVRGVKTVQNNVALRP